MGDGAFETADPTVIKVGSDPEAMVIGSFERRDQSDLVTVNTGSDDLTYVANVFGPNPTGRTISSDGTRARRGLRRRPDAHRADGPGRRHGGDGHLAVFRGGDSGLQLAGVITPASLPTPTALAPGSSGGDVLDFFAAGAGDDSALLLQFDLGVASTYLPGSSEDSGGIAQADAELFAQLMPFDGSSLDLIAALWSGSPDGEAGSALATLREPSTLTVLYSPTEGQGGDDPGRLPATSAAPEPPADPVNPPEGDDSAWARMVSGVDEALGRPRRLVEALAARDVLDEEGDRPASVEGLVRLDPGGDRPEADRPLDAPTSRPSPASSAAARSACSGPRPLRATAEGKDQADPSPGPGLDGDEPQAIDGGGLDAVPLVSTAVLASTGLIIKASPPRPPAYRGPSWFRRFVSRGHDPRTPNGPTP